MTEEANGLYQQILIDPTNVVPRNMLVDLWMESGRDYAFCERYKDELARWDTTKHHTTSATWSLVRPDGWGFPGTVGCVAGVPDVWVCSCGQFRRHGPKVFEEHPIRRVAITDARVTITIERVRYPDQYELPGFWTAFAEAPQVTESRQVYVQNLGHRTENGAVIREYSRYIYHSPFVQWDDPKNETATLKYARAHLFGYLFQESRELPPPSHLVFLAWLTQQWHAVDGAAYQEFLLEEGRRALRHQGYMRYHDVERP